MKLFESLSQIDMMVVDVAQGLVCEVLVRSNVAVTRANGVLVVVKQLLQLT